MIALVGLSHRTAPITVRERVALGPSAARDLLEQLVRCPPVREALVLSTCNRVEFVVAPAAERLDQVELAARTATRCFEQLEPGVLRHLYVKLGWQAVEHVFRVACSLDSLVVGEPQILGQLKEAFGQGVSAGTVGTSLHRVCTRAFRLAKRVRTLTAIGSGRVSVPGAALQLAEQILGNLGGRRVALVGTGEIGRSVASFFARRGARLLVVGRSPGSVEGLVRGLGGAAEACLDLQECLVQADVVVTSTNSSGYVIDQALVSRAARLRRDRSLFFVDLAVPRDVDPRVEQVEGVFLYNIDDLSQVAVRMQHRRERETEQAEQMVRHELVAFRRWMDAQRVTPTIVAMRRRFGRVLEAELERTLAGKLRHLGEQERAALHTMLEAALDKLLDTATRRLRRAATDRGTGPQRADQLVWCLRHLFDLVPDLSPGGDGQARTLPSPRERPEVLRSAPDEAPELKP